MKIWALLTDQGTAASETMLCDDDLKVHPARELVQEKALASIDIPSGPFVDVSDNDEAACVWCGRDATGEVR